MKKIETKQKEVLKELKKLFSSHPRAKDELKMFMLVPDFSFEVDGGNITTLRLKGSLLTTLPDPVGNLGSIQELDLIINQLTTLPESIGHLKSLIYLILGSNKLLILPESIGNLESLQYIDLSHNNLTTLPESIGNLESLQYIDLKHNNLTTLPESIGNLESLQYIDLKHNKFVGESNIKASSLTELNKISTIAYAMDAGSLIKLSLPAWLLPWLLVFVIKAIFLKKKVVLISLEDFLLNHDIINFFSYVTQYNANITMLSRRDYDKNQAKYNDYFVLEYTSSQDNRFITISEKNKDKSIIRDKDEIINLKELEKEEIIVSKFLNEPRFLSFFKLKNDIEEMANILYGYTLEEWQTPGIKIEIELRKRRVAEKERMMEERRAIKEVVQKKRDELNAKLSPINSLIQDQQFSNAIKTLSDVIEEAKSYALNEVLKWAEDMLRSCEVKEREFKRKELETKLSAIEYFLYEKNFSNAIRELDSIINEAKSFDFKGILKRAFEELNLCKAKEREHEKIRLERKLSTIENLIQEKNFLTAISELRDLKNEAQFYNFKEILSIAEEKLKYCKQLEKISLIKKTVLALGTKFGRLQIIEIAEECGEKNDLIITTVKEMIANKEIYAKYFESSKSVAFDQQTNIEEIDKLMKAYKNWEDKELGKK